MAITELNGSPCSEKFSRLEVIAATLIYLKHDIPPNVPTAIRSFDLRKFALLQPEDVVQRGIR